MTTWVYTVVRNEATLMRYWLRHYLTFCDRIIVYDDHSDDGTQDIVRAAGAELREYPGNGLDDIAFVRFANQQYREARGQADYVIWVDGDEFLYHPRIKQRLERMHRVGVTLPQTQGYNMLGQQPPTGPGQIYDEIKDGFRDARYSKPVIVSPTLDVEWTVGKHEMHILGEKITFTDSGSDPLKLLHFRYLGRAYHEQRSARNYEHLSDQNKSNNLGWEVMPGWQGIYSTDWYEQQRSVAEVCV